MKRLMCPTSWGFFIPQFPCKTQYHIASTKCHAFLWRRNQLILPRLLSNKCIRCTRSQCHHQIKPTTSFVLYIIVSIIRHFFLKQETLIEKCLLQQCNKSVIYLRTTRRTKPRRSTSKVWISWSSHTVLMNLCLCRRTSI